MRNATNRGAERNYFFEIEKHRALFSSFFCVAYSARKLERYLCIRRNRMRWDFLSRIFGGDDNFTFYVIIDFCGARNENGKNPKEIQSRCVEIIDASAKACWCGFV